MARIDEELHWIAQQPPPWRDTAGAALRARLKADRPRAQRDAAVRLRAALDGQVELLGELIQRARILRLAAAAARDGVEPGWKGDVDTSVAPWFITDAFWVDGEGDYRIESVGQCR